MLTRRLQQGGQGFWFNMKTRHGGNTHKQGVGKRHLLYFLPGYKMKSGGLSNKRSAHKNRKTKELVSSSMASCLCDLIQMNYCCVGVEGHGCGQNYTDNGFSFFFRWGVQVYLHF